MTPRPVFFDTGHVIALLNRNDPYHATARDWHIYLRSRRRPHLTTTAVLLELGDGFAQRGRWDLIAPFLEAVALDPLVGIIEVDRGHSLIEPYGSSANDRIRNGV